MSDKQDKLRQDLKNHAKEQLAMGRAQIALVRRAHKAGVPLQEVAEILGLSLRTAYNRLEGKGPRVGADWHA